ncbi:hypothetical protein JCM10213_001032 [Rhodosporidiobolus nylandii]
MNYTYISHSELEPLVKAGAIQKGELAIVDVRDDDREGGHIPGSIHAPSEERTDASVQELVERLKDARQVVFHCGLSQVRGPKAARIYAEAAAAARAFSSAPSAPSAPPADTIVPSSSGSATDVAAAEAARTFSPNPYPHARPKEEGKQEVLVLRDGFKNWQSLYKEDALLVEDFDPRVWPDFTDFGPKWN